MSVSLTVIMPIHVSQEEKRNLFYNEKQISKHRFGQKIDV